MRTRCHAWTGRSLVVAGALAVAGYAAPVAAQEADRPERPAAQLYHAYCSLCHGERGDGRSRAQASLVPPTRDFTAPGAALDLTRERMIAAVREGCPGTAMAAWGTQLSLAEIEAVVDYIREHLMRPVAGHAAAADAC